MYITPPTHVAGVRPSKTQAPTATRLTTPNADQCLHQPREGRGRNRQRPPPTKRGRGARDGPAATKLPTHTTRGGQTPQPDGTEDGTHLPPRDTGGPPSQNRRHPTESSCPPEERTPRTHQHTPRWGRDGQKKTPRRNSKERRSGDGDHEAQDRDSQRRTPHSHNTTGLKTKHPPPQPDEKIKRGGGGTNPTKGNTRTSPRHRQPPPEGDGKQSRRTQEATRPSTQVRN